MAILFADKKESVRAHLVARKISDYLFGSYWAVDPVTAAMQAEDAHNKLVDLAAIYGYDLVPLSVQEGAA